MLITAAVHLDYPNLLAGALLGALAGFSVAWLAAWLSRPRIKHYGFVKRLPAYEDGHLHKLWFELKGRSAPGLCSLELTCEERSRFAKWDESGSPLTNRQAFWPEMVPGTAMQALHLGRIYCVPLIYEKDGELRLFSGWWYGRRTFPDAVPAVHRGTTIRVALTGQGLTWNEEFRVGRQICDGPSVTNADSDAHQSALRRHVDQQESLWLSARRTANPSAYFRAGQFPRIRRAPLWALNRLRSGPRQSGAEITNQRPLADWIEVGAPWLAALAARTLARLPEPIRRRALQSAVDRARDAFNRGDFEAVFALFAPDVEYGPPTPLHGDGPLRGRAAVLDFWRGVRARYDDSTIENLSLEEATPGRVVRRARLHHRSRAIGEDLAYVIIQHTELDRGRVVRQINVLGNDP